MAEVGPDLTPACFFDHRTRPFAEVGADEVAVADIAQETDALAVPAVPRGEAEPGRDLAHLGLSHPAHREERPPELRGADPGEEIGLVLHRIGRPVELDAAGDLDPPRVVPRRHPLEAARKLRVHPVGEGPELDAGVAEEVGARGAAALELGEQVGDHSFAVGALQRDHRERGAAPVGHRTREAEILLPGAFPQVLQLVFEPYLEVEGFDLVARFHQTGESDGAVHASGGEDGDPHGRIMPRGR